MSAETFFDEDGREWPADAEWCDRCQGSGIANCYCGGDQCYCENYGEMECPTCHGEGMFVPTAAFKAAREQSSKWWREYQERLAAEEAEQKRAKKTNPKTGKTPLRRL
jgi:hypothetical protein